MARVGIAISALALGLLISDAVGAKHVWFGMVVKVDGDGFFLNPTVKSATIQKVVPDSPVAQQSLVAGDQIIEVEGHPVVGTKAKELEPFMRKAIGEPLHLRLKHESGQLCSATLIAAREPK